MAELDPVVKVCRYQDIKKDCSDKFTTLKNDNIFRLINKNYFLFCLDICSVADPIRNRFLPNPENLQTKLLYLFTNF